MRGVGKTTLAAAYAEQRRDTYRATWWIRAETEATMRADLVGLGVRLGWVAADATEDPALAGVLERLRDDGDSILLVYDNASGPNEIRKYLPRGGMARIIVTSTAPDWGGVAAPIEIEIWPEEIGAEYLIARTGREEERISALALSETLGGLPLAHEQVAAFCARLGISLADYLRRFDANPAKLLSMQKDVPYDYGRTVATTFALAIDEAAKLDPAAESLIVYAALLAPGPIPLFLFSEEHEKLGAPLATAIANDGLDEVVAALRAFALVDREVILDERDPLIATDCIRLHRLVRQVAAGKFDGDTRENMRRELIEAITAAYPSEVHSDPKTWPRARRLDSLAMALVARDDNLPKGSELSAADLLGKLDSYRDGALAAYAEALTLSERALAIRQKTLGCNHPDTAMSLNNVGYLLREQGDLAGARPYYERALAIYEKTLGLDHPDTARSLSNLGGVLQAQGDLAGARPCYERALVILEKALGSDHPDTATSLNNLGYLLREQGDLAGARPYYERALAIYERALGPDHPKTALGLNNLGYLLGVQRDISGAQPYYERALAIREKVLGPDHPDTAKSLEGLGGLLRAQGDPAGARPYYERALTICRKVFGTAHPTAKTIAGDTASVLEALKCLKEAKELREEFGISDQGEDRDPT